MDVVHTQRRIARRDMTNDNNNDDQRNLNGDKEKPRIGSPLQRLRRRRRAKSEPPRRRLLEEHFRVRDNKVLPGVIRFDDDWARDTHDFFNLVALIPIVVLNCINWNWDILLNMPKRIPDAWTGDYFVPFFVMTLLYFAADLLWILVVPTCVRSPSTIIQHHIATMLYVLIPYFQPEYQWCMGACMIVEVNTWFLIARRVFNKQGFPPWIIDLSFVSVRVKVISILFYVTWIAIRCILYPYLMPLFFQVWLEHSKRVHTHWNIVFLCVPLHACFCLLNLKWTYDLVVSKLRYWRRGGLKEGDKGL